MQQWVQTSVFAYQMSFYQCSPLLRRYLALNFNANVMFSHRGSLMSSYFVNISLFENHGHLLNESVTYLKIHINFILSLKDTP